MKRLIVSGFLSGALLSGCTQPVDRPAETPSDVNQSSKQSIAGDVLARRQLTRAALAKLKEQSLFTGDVDWDSIDEKLEKQIANVQTDDDIKTPLTTALNHLRDPHARFFYQGRMFAHFSDWGNERNRDNRPIDQDAKRRFELEHDHHFELLGAQTGYIKIKGIGPGDDANQQAAHIRSGLEKLAAKGAKNWILDLRYNTGGNMHPMMSGVGPLLCDGVVGGEAGFKGDIIGNWSMKADNFYMRDYNAVPLPASGNIPCDAKVAVLISRYTLSSGEAVASTFKGRSHTRFFGEPTGGLTTVTNWDPVNEELTMSIAVSYYADRNNNVFKQNIAPDDPIEFSPEHPLKSDPAITAARDWLSKP